jgi:hypothetical protein
MDKIKTYNWYFGTQHTSTITVNFTTKKVSVVHHSDVKPICAFSGKTNITFNSWEDMIAGRCIPSTQVGAMEKLAKIGITEYDPYKIIEKTHGALVHDAFEIVPVEG